LSYRRKPPVATPSQGVNDAHANEGGELIALNM